MAYNNKKIRIALLQNDIKHYELARKLKIASTSLSRKLRSILSGKEEDKILKAIEELKQEKRGILGQE